MPNLSGYGPELDHLAGRWASRREGPVFAALADGLRKRGALDAAAALAAEGTELFPGYLPGYIVLARIRRDAGDLPAAAAALRAGLAHDAGHPVVLDELARLHEITGQAAGSDHSEPERAGAGAGMTATAVMGTIVNEAPETEPHDLESGTESDRLVFVDEAVVEVVVDDESEPDPVVTESLALLYLGQGHLERALEVFEALVTRDEHNAELRARRDALRRELAGRRPRHYDAAESGGQSVASWLAAVAAARPEPQRTLTGFDAFFHAPPAPAAGDTDLEAFQLWLKELGR